MSLGTEVDTELKHAFQRFKTERQDSERFKFMAYLTPFLSKISVVFTANDPNQPDRKKTVFYDFP